MQNDRGNLSIDFLAGITIFMIALIWVATMIPGLLVGVQTRTIDVDAISYRTGVILTEDPGMPITPPWENKNDYQKNEVERFGLAASKDTPNILKMAKIERFFCSTSFSYPTDYKNRLIFGDRPYGFNITLSTFDGVLTRSVGELKPEEYGYIRRLVKIKYPSNTTIDAQTLRNSANVSQHVFSVQLNITELIGMEPNYAYQINPRRDQIMVNFTNLSGAKVYTTATNRITLNSIDIYRRNPLPPYTYSKVTMYMNDDPKFLTYIDGSAVTATLPSLVNDNVSVIFMPGYFYGMADDFSTLKISYTFNLTDPDYFFNNSFTLPYSYNYSPAHVTQPRLKEGVLEVATWTAPFGSYAPSLVTATPTPVQPPVADFYGTPRTGSKPLLVAFTDMSTGVPTTWNWTFGDIGPGNTSTLQNPTHTYTSVGSYSVNLTVSNVYGSSTLIKTNYITPGLKIPVPGFTATPLSGVAPLPVAFTDTSTNNPTIWAWNFGDIGAGNTSTLQNPSHTYTKTGRYTVNLTASTGDGNATEIKTNYITVNPATSWKCDATGWNYRKNITIDRTKVYGTQTDFPVLINLGSDANLATRARPDAYDIFFTASDGTTKLPHEIENFTISNGALVAWVKVPSISDAANTTIFMYYGNPSAGDQQDKNNVWDSNYVAVHHMKGASYTALDDSTSNHNDVTSQVDVPTYNSAGQMGYATTFGGNDAVEIADSASLDITSQVTVSAWIRPSSISAWNRIVVKSHTSNTDPYTMYGLLFDDFTHIREEISSGGVQYGANGATGVSTGTWTYACIVYDHSNLIVYRNGVSDGSPTALSSNINTNTMPLSIGRSGFNADYYSGRIDEVRVSNTGRSANWIRTEYNNQYSPSTFHYIGSEESWTCDVTPTPTPTPTTATPTPTPTPAVPWYCGWAYRKNITIQAAQVSGTNSDFPVLVNLTSDSGLAGNAQTDGDDILFTTSDGMTKIPHEIESYNPGNGALNAWVKVPSVTSASNTIIMMYYGNAGAASQQDTTNVWDSNFRAVWHMKTDLTDSTSNSNLGLNSGTTDIASSISGRARDFDGGNDRINVAHSTSLQIPGAITVEAWIRPDTLLSWDTVISKFGGSSPGASDDLYIVFDGTSLVVDLHDAVDWYPGISGTTGSWQHIAVSYDGSSTARAYKNGAVVSTPASGSLNLGTSTNPLYIGYNQEWSEWWDGRIDEVRISNTRRTGSWITTEYNNQNSPSTFHTVGSEAGGSC